MKTIRNIVIAGLTVLAISLSVNASAASTILHRNATVNADTAIAPAESIPYFPVIYFKTDRYSIDKVQEWKIEDIACYMEEYPETVLLVKGWTDSKGTEEGNERLSQLRADEVKERLVRSGVDSWRIIAIGMGETVIGSEASASRRAESEILSR